MGDAAAFDKAPTESLPPPPPTLPWTEKYRPDDFAAVCHHADVKRVLGTLLRKPNWPPVLLYGPPGTGKTSMLHAAKAVVYGNGEQQWDACLELNASDVRDELSVRQMVRTFARSRSVNAVTDSTRAPTTKRTKMVILDECDGLTTAAQTALGRVMLDNVGACGFLAACNHPEALLPALRSMFSCLRCGPLPPDAALDYAARICAREGLVLLPCARDAVTSLAAGNARYVANLLQVCRTALFTTRTDVGVGVRRRDEQSDRCASPPVLVVDASLVYSLSSRASPQSVHALLRDSLLNPKADLASKKCAVDHVLASTGTDLAELIHDIFACACAPVPFHAFPSLDSRTRCELVEGLAACEERARVGTTPALQVAGLCSVFVITAALQEKIEDR